MTHKEIITLTKPFALDPAEEGGVHGCPWYWGLEEEQEGWQACQVSHSLSRHPVGGVPVRDACRLCWNRNAKEAVVRASMERIQAATRKKERTLTRILRRIGDWLHGRKA